MQIGSINTMATGRITKKVLDYIKQVNIENTQRRLANMAHRNMLLKKVRIKVKYYDC